MSGIKPAAWLAALAFAVALLLPGSARAQGLTVYYCFLHDPAADALYMSPIAPVGPVAERASYGDKFRARLVAAGRITADGPAAFCVMRATHQEIDQSRALLVGNCPGCGPATRRVDFGGEAIAAAAPAPPPPPGPGPGRRRLPPPVAPLEPRVKVLPNLIAPTMPDAQPVDPGNSSTFAKGEVCIPKRRRPGEIIEINDHCRTPTAKAPKTTKKGSGTGTGAGGSGSGGTDGSGTPGNGDPGNGDDQTPPGKPGTAPVVWKEGVAVCSVALKICKGPMYNSFYRPETLKSALESVNCTAGRELGQQGEWRIYGCGYGINPVIVERSRAESWHWDWITHLSLQQPPGRWRFRCKASQFEYCKVRA